VDLPGNVDEAGVLAYARLTLHDLEPGEIHVLGLGDRAPETQ
jgi:hypothetical protein